MTVLADPALTAATVTSTDSVTSATPDPDTSNNTASNTSSVIVNANLKITLSHTGSFIAGTNNPYSLAASNLGPSNAVNAVATLTLPSGFTYVSASGASCSATGTTVTCALGNLAVNATVPFTITVAVDPALTGTATPTAAISSDSPDGTTSNNTFSNATTVVARTDLVTTLAHVGAFVPGQAASYMMTVTNNGPSVATGVSLTLTVPSSLTFGALPSGCIANSATKITCTVGTLAPSAGQTFSIPVAIAANAPASLTATAAATSTTTDPNTANNKATDTVATTPTADLSVTLTHTDPFTAGTSAKYTIAVTNNGPSTTGGIVATLTLPSGLTYTSATGATCSASGATVTCTVSGTIATGSTKSIVVTVGVASTLTGTVTPTVTVSSTATDPNTANNTASNATNIVSSADLKVTMTHSGSFKSGTNGSYTMSVSNAGPSTATNVVVTINLPAGFAFAGATGATCSAAGATVTCTLGTLAPGATINFTLTVAVTLGISGTFTPTATVSSSTTDPNTANNAVSNPTTVKR